MLLQSNAPQEENLDRWVISYADFVTLLCALFVVLYAGSIADRAKARQMARSFYNANHRTAEPAEKNGFDRSLDWLKVELGRELREEKLDVHLERRGLVVSMREATCFRVGEAEISPEAFPVIEKIASVARRLNCPLRLEGHTDSLPIHSGRFRSNWELSSARSIAVMEVLTSRYGIPKERLAIAGYADNYPIDSNASEKGRTRNRRVDVVFLDDDAASGRDSRASR